MAKIMHQHAQDPSEADSYERATAYLSEWIEDSLVVPTSKDAHQPQQRRFSLPTAGPKARPLRRRNTVDDGAGVNSNEDAINSLVQSLRATLVMHENVHNPNYSSQSKTNSPACMTTMLHSQGRSGDMAHDMPTLPFDGRQRQQGGAAAVRSDTPSPREGEKRHVPCSLRRRSSGVVGNGAEADTVRLQSSSMMHKQGSKQDNSSSSGKRERPTKNSTVRRRPYNRRHTIDHPSTQAREHEREDDCVMHSSMDDLLESPHQSQYRRRGSKKEDPPTMVVSLQWKGGYYTGQVNTLVQPHGTGAFQYDNGKVIKGTWNNGHFTFNDTAGVMHGNATHAKNGVHASRSRESNEEKIESKPPRKKSNSHSPTHLHPLPSHTEAAEGKCSQPSTQRPLDRLSELDGPMFDLGDTFRHPKHQIIESDPNKALDLISQLRIHDFAWILRSTREWTYAIVADFPERGEGDASILFVIDKAGNTKTLKRRHWVKCIRMVDQVA